MRHEILLLRADACMSCIFATHAEERNWPFLFPLPLAASASRAPRCTALEVCGRDIHMALYRSTSYMDGEIPSTCLPFR